MQWLTLIVNLAATLGLGGALLGGVRWVKSKNAPSVAETWNRLTATALEEAEKRARTERNEYARRSREQDRKIEFCEQRCYVLMAGWEDEIDAYDALLSRLASNNVLDTTDLEASLTGRRSRLREVKTMRPPNEDHHRHDAPPPPPPGE